MDLAGFGAAVRDVASRAEASLASDCARTAAREFLGALQVTTPVETGALRASEHVFGVTGGGAVAVAVVGSDLIYAHFRNFGGTITKQVARVAGYPGGRVLRPFGHPGRVTLHGTRRGGGGRAYPGGVPAYLDEFLVI